MCMVQPKGTTTSVISSGMPNPSLQSLTVYGSVAALLQVVMVMIHILYTFLIYSKGPMPANMRTGSIMTMIMTAREHT